MSEHREYETICVFAPDLQDEALKKVDDKIKKIFTSHKVKEVTKKDWGNRKLAYPIKNYKTANFVQYIFKAPTDLVAELEKNLGYEESVLRYLTIKYTKHTKQGVLVEPSGFEVSDY